MGGALCHHAADTLVPFAAGTELAPGTSRWQPTAQRPATRCSAESAGQNFFYVPTHQCSGPVFPHPYWAVTFDMDADAARKVRREVSSALPPVRHAVRFHFPFPALAHGGVGTACFQPAA